MNWLARRRYPRWSARLHAGTRLRDLSCVVLDCETTGLRPFDGDRLVSVFAVAVDSLAITEQSFGTLVSPGVPIPPEATAIHGITDQLVGTAPSPGDAVTRLREFVGNCPVVGQVVSFDLAFLDPIARRTRLAPFPVALDTLLMSTVLWPERDIRHGLDALAERLGIEVVDRHTARGDALATARAFVAMVPMMEERGLMTMRDVVAACQATPRAAEFAKRYRR
jgi:DNA polymerase-3 subunit epsilon